MRSLALALVAGLAAAGCLGEDADGEPSVGGPPPVGNVASWNATLPCTFCYEPTVASDGVHLFATTGSGTVLHRFNGTGWEQLPAPPIDGLPDPTRGDIFVQVDAAGRLWWHALVLDDGQVDRRIQVARSDDAGLTWAVNQALEWGPAGGQQASVADRNWLATDGDTVYAFCTCPAAALGQMRVSTDAGATFGPTTPVPTSPGRAGPIGPPALGPDGTLVVPYLVGPFALPDGPHAAAVEAAVSHDGGATWDRRTVWGAESAAPELGTVCCAFPGSLGDADGFALAWSAGDGRVRVATSPDGDTWEVGVLADGPAGYPHPWPVRIGGVLGAAWSTPGDEVHVTLGNDTVVGQAPGNVGDYVTAATHQGRVVTAFPTGDGFAVEGR